MNKIEYSSFRFSEEVDLVKELEDGFGLKNFYNVFENEVELKNIIRSYMSGAVRLTEVIAPRLYGICKQVKEKLNFQEDIEFFIAYNVYFQAYAINGCGIVPHIICFTSALIEKFTDDELMFVIGHEIGHLICMHSQLNLVKYYITNPDKPLPTQLTNLFSRWRKYAEISSDRIGFLAQPNLEVIGRIFFKFASGLSDQHLNFNIKEYMKQLDNIKGMSHQEFQASHPTNLIRLKCLELFAQSAYFNENTKISNEELQKQIKEALLKLEIHPIEEYDIKALEFIVSVGMYVAGADKEMNPNERTELYDLCSDYTSQPEIYLRFKDYDELVNRKNAICEHFANSQDGTKFNLCYFMVILAACDRKLDESEKTVLYEIAERLNIEKKVINNMILKATEDYGIQPPDTNGGGLYSFFDNKGGNNDF